MSDEDQIRPMDGTGTLRRRGRDGQPLEDYFGGADVHGGYWVQQVDAWPHGPLQAQLDRIEALLTPIELSETTVEGVNRWAALTDAELDALRGMVGEFIDSHGVPTQDEQRLQDEIDAEIDRRKA